MAGDSFSSVADAPYEMLIMDSESQCFGLVKKKKVPNQVNQYTARIIKGISGGEK